MIDVIYSKGRFPLIRASPIHLLIGEKYKLYSKESNNHDPNDTFDKRSAQVLARQEYQLHLCFEEIPDPHKSWNYQFFFHVIEKTSS